MYPLFQHPQKTMINNDVITVLFPEVQKNYFIFSNLRANKQIQLWRLRKSHQTELETFSMSINILKQFVFAVCMLLYHRDGLYFINHSTVV